MFKHFYKESSFAGVGVGETCRYQSTILLVWIGKKKIVFVGFFDLMISLLPDIKYAGNRKIYDVAEAESL